MLSFIYISPVAMAETPKNDEDIERVSVMGKQIKRSSSPTGLDLAVQETPQSISVINADFIESFDQKNLEEVMQ
ncbi:hypothetical protein PULV_a4269 [Pseudoalteromonas ulvae UL12]|nr:hypothetical protein [Pseudoalteromonas ulvae UL12]